jgi:hypothetical protein
MTATIRNLKDFWAGLIYIAIGLAAIFFARDYGMGSATKMGPAYFPSVLGGLLAIIGAASVVRSFLRNGQPIGTIAVKGMLFVCGSTVLFAALVRGAGLVIALIVLVLVAAYGSIKFKLSTTIILALALTVACVLVFIKGLGIPLPLFGSWFDAWLGG